MRPAFMHEARRSIARHGAGVGLECNHIGVGGQRQKTFGTDSYSQRYSQDVVPTPSGVFPG